MRSYELKKKKGNLGLFLAAFFFISGYIFFLSSEMWMPSRLSASLQTPLRKAIDWGERTLEIRRWDYCERTEIMEIELDMENKAFDGKNHYHYSAVSRNGGQLEVKPIIEDEDWIILRIHNVSSQFGEISLRLAREDREDDILRLYTNVNAVGRVESLEKKDRKGYQILRLETEIAAYEKDIRKKEKKVKSIKEKNARMQEEINRLQSSSAYQTEEQKSETAEKIGDIQSEMTANQDTIQSHEQQITEITERIVLLKEQISQ